MTEAFDFAWDSSWGTAEVREDSNGAVMELRLWKNSKMSKVAELPGVKIFNRKPNILEDTNGVDETLAGYLIPNEGGRTVMELEDDDKLCYLIGTEYGFRYTCFEKFE